MAAEAMTSTAIRSMTGFALVRRDTAAGELSVSLRSVNGRGLDLHLHQGSEFAVFENTVRALLKGGIRRGHVEVRLGLARPSQSGNGAYNKEQLGKYLTVFRQASSDFELDATPDLHKFFSMPGVLDAPQHQELGSSFENDLTQALQSCMAELNVCREREGSELRYQFEAEAAEIEAGATRITELRVDALPVLRQRLADRLRELLKESTISESRLTEEAAILADRSDIGEELTRLTVHTGELRRILREGGEIGKRLDFLLQEMNRETNTILSKTSGAGEIGLSVSAAALGIKANIERIREQALNLE